MATQLLFGGARRAQLNQLYLFEIGSDNPDPIYLALVVIVILKVSIAAMLVKNDFFWRHFFKGLCFELVMTVNTRCEQGILQDFIFS